MGSSQIRDPTGVTFLKKYLFGAVLGLRGHAGFSVVAVLRLLTAVASVVAEHQL